MRIGCTGETPFSGNRGQRVGEPLLHERRLLHWKGTGGILVLSTSAVSRLLELSLWTRWLNSTAVS